MTPPRERRVARTFVALADTLVADFDITEFLSMLPDRCVELLAVPAAGVILVAPDGELRVAATSSERAELLELFAVEIDAGPCVDCVRGGEPVADPDLSAQSQRWPRFVVAAHERGFRAVQAVPMRLREQIVGVLTLLNTEPGALGEDRLDLGQALADVATIALLQHRQIERGDRLSGQLRTALTSRVLIEQAKGVLAEHGGMSVDEAFTRLRDHARAHNQRLTDLARAVTERTTDLTAILTYHR
jgi:GAF domain-containing protein